MDSGIKPVGSSSPVIGVNPYGVGSETTSPLPGAFPNRRLSSREAEAMVKELNEAMRILNTRLSFTIDKATRKTVVRVMDAETQEVIRQIPPEEMLRIAARIIELLGVLFDESG